MKLADMKRHRDQYYARMSKSHAAIREGLFFDAVKHALAAWEFIDGMIQYARKKENREFTSIPSIDVVLKHAPLLLDFESLDTLERLLKSAKRIEKYTSKNMGEKLQEARNLLWDVHRAWDHFELEGQATLDGLCSKLEGKRARWKTIVQGWTKMGLLTCSDVEGVESFSLTTRLGAIVSGKCPNCGRTAQAPKAVFLEVSTCPHCEDSVVFVILPEFPSGNGEES